MRSIRDARFGNRITYSPKVFIPLTMLCRDKCGYCTFAKAPAHIEAPYLSAEQVVSIASAGARAGCHEALITLGERPELRYPVAQAWLADRGYVAFVVDSYGPRKEPADCKDDPKNGKASGPSTARFDDAIGALRYLQAQPFVIPERVASFGWSQGGLFAISVINGPTLDRARARGVALPRVGYAAAIAMYPGGCRDYATQLVVRPLLLLLGGADDWTPPQYCRELAANMKARGADVTLVEYKGAYHYFDVVGQRKEVLKEIEQPFTPGTFGVTVAYDAEAAADAQRQVEAFLARVLKGLPAP